MTYSLCPLPHGERIELSARTQEGALLEAALTALDQSIEHYYVSARKDSL